MDFKSFDRKKANQIAVHILVWAFLFAAPILFSMRDPMEKVSVHFLAWIPMSFSVMLFYLNYFVLVERYLFRRRLLLYFGINMVAIALVGLIAELVIHNVMPPIFENAMGRPTKVMLIGRLISSMAFTISISVAIRVTGRWYKLETERKNLENLNLQTELNNLKMQLNPHFFFNTLNNIYSLISLSPEKAQEAVHKLAKLMRYHLYETETSEVPLEGEVEFMKSYISLMQLRTTDKVKVDSSFTLENASARIAPLMFISLVENAFKHGVSPVGESEIRFELVEKDRIVSFDSWNSNFPGHEIGAKANGIGLENLQKRLSLIYPGRYSFHKELEADVFHVKVVIQL